MKSFKMFKLLMLFLLIVAIGGSTIYAAKAEIVMTCNAGFPYDVAAKALVESFEKQNPGIKVKVEHYPYAQILSVTEVKLGARSAVPDIIFTDAPLVYAYTSRGYLLPLDKYFSGKEKSQWVPAALKTVKVNKKIMAAPLMNSTQVLYYNKKIFKEMGIPFPSKDPDKRMTYEQVLEIAKKLTIDTNKDGVTDIWGFCFAQVNRTYQLLVLPESLGAKVISRDGLKTTGIINSPKWIKAFQFYQDLFNKWKVSPKGVSSSETTNYFFSGRLAMVITGVFNFQKFNNTKGLEWDYAPHPYFAGGKPITPTGSWCLGVNRYSKNKEAAIKFVRYLTTAPGAIEWFKNDGHISPNKKVLDYIMAEPSYDKWPLTIYGLANHETQETAVPRPLTSGYREYEELLNATFEDIRNGSNIKDSLTSAAGRIDRMLLKYKK
jgi:ABC-type glycerol-3-phosphate transport system substrate-binding protein